MPGAARHRIAFDAGFREFQGRVILRPTIMPHEPHADIDFVRDTSVDAFGHALWRFFMGFSGSGLLGKSWWTFST
jgi:hypothetical protein